MFSRQPQHKANAGALGQLRCGMPVVCETIKGVNPDNRQVLGF